ncbi:TPA: hypothetical protein SK294_001942 [Yersinia enterocolitica]|nr:hypothetical protein [Yersinia enterocolitica]
MLSKEQLEKIANQGPVDIGGAQNPIVTEMATELLSLREQLAELKQQKPIGRVISCNGNKTLGWINDAPEGTLLFAAAKPAAGLGVEDITEFMRKAFWRGFESARGTGNSNIPEHWKDSKPNLLLALKAKISGA